MEIAQLLERAQSVKTHALTLTAAQKNEILCEMADALLENAQRIMTANEQDMQKAKSQISETMLDRLMLNLSRIEGMAQGLRALTLLEDPIGQELSHVQRPNGLVIRRVRVPMGVVAVIYESRPNVTSDAAGLCLKSGNVCVLRGGREALATNREIVKALHAALERTGHPCELVQLVEDTGREGAAALMQARGKVDLLIPRGGKGLIQACVEQAKVPCIETGTGICHIIYNFYFVFERRRYSRPHLFRKFVIVARGTRARIYYKTRVFFAHLCAADCRSFESRLFYVIRA